MELRIYYDDTDTGGVVYHANYLKYFERGRTEYMLKRGVDPAEMAKKGQVFVVVWTELFYLSPARLGDTIIIEAFLDEISGASIIFSYKVFLKNKVPENNKLLVTGKTKLALVDPDMKIQRFSANLLNNLKSVL